MKKLQILKNPLLLIFFIVAGVLTGLYFKEFSLNLKIISEIYLALLKMCVIPIVVTAVISSLAKLFRSEHGEQYIKRIIAVFVVALIIVSCLSVAVELVMKPGQNIGKQAEITLGKLINSANIQLSKNMKKEESKGFTEFIKEMIPENIFGALSNGVMLQILFFAIIFGIATGFLPHEHRDTIISINEAFFKGFFKIIDWAMYLLPFALFCLLSSQIAGTGIDIIIAMIKFVMSIYLISLILMAANGLILKFYSGTSFTNTFFKLKNCLLIGFGTLSTIASIPATIEDMTDGLKFNRELINLVVTIGGVLIKFSMIILHSAAVIFTAQLYHVSLGLKGYILCVFLSSIASFACAGSPGVVAITLITIILTPLKLPSETIIVLLLAVNPILEPLLTSANIHTICASAAIIEGRR
jgi:proton glutamate symport protein